MINANLIDAYLEDNGLPPNQGYVTKVNPDTGEEFIHNWSAAIPEPDASLLAGYRIAAQAKADLKVWEEKMKLADRFMPRSTEDLIDALIAKGTITAADLPADPQDPTKGLGPFYQEKKAVRAGRPA